VELHHSTLIEQLMVELRRSGGLCNRVESGEQAPPETTLPTAADLNMMVQKYFKRQRSGNPQIWDQGFENGYTDAFNKAHLRK
jgi:hypothetical protein